MGLHTSTGHSRNLIQHVKTRDRASPENNPAVNVASLALQEPFSDFCSNHNSSTLDNAALQILPLIFRTVYDCEKIEPLRNKVRGPWART